jgi:hypothetical protein
MSWGTSSAPGRPRPSFAELVGDIERALLDRTLPARKAAMQAVVGEVWVRSRRHIEHVFRVRFLDHRMGRCPRQDSNLRTRLRRPALYPLSYEGERTESNNRS